MIITREKGMRMWGGGSGSTSASGVNGGGGFSLAVTESEGTGNAYTGFTYESGVLSLIKGEKFVTVDFFNRLFTSYDSDGNAILPNDVTSTINNLKLLVGTWTEEYLSALGKNSEEGGGGGTGTVTAIKIASNTYLDPDSDGIIDMSNYVSTSADRANWNTAYSQRHTHSNKSVLDGITSAKVTSWDNVAKIMEDDADAIINKWDEIIDFLDGIPDQSTLAEILAAKANTSTTVTSVSYASKKLQKTINGTTTDIVTASTLFSDGLPTNTTKNYVLAAPSNAAGTPTFRALVAADLPNLYIGKTQVQSTSANQAMTGITSIDALAYFDMTNSRVGIGTSSPSYKLHVNGYTSTTRLYLSSDVYLEYDSTNGGIHVVGAGLYSDSYVSALGSNSEGGGSGADLEDVWDSLTNQQGTVITDNTKIAIAHIPDTSSTYGYLKSSALNGYATQSWVNQQGFLTTHQSIYVLTLKAGGTAVTTFTPNSADASLDFVAGTNISLTKGTNKITIANTYSYILPTATSDTLGGVKIGYSETNSGTSTTRNYAVKLSSEKMYVNVPWTDTTYKLTLNGTTNGASGGTSLGSFYAPTASGTANQVLISGGSNTAPSWTAQSNLSVGTAAKLGTGTTTYSAWGQTYWSSGVPQSISGNMTSVGSITPSANGNALGTTSARFNIYGTSGNFSGNVSISGTLGVTGATTLSSTLSVAGGITLTTTKKIYFGDTSHYLELDSTGFHFSHGIYSDSFVSALGANSSGGGGGTFDEEAMWEALGTTSTAKVIASSHIPNLSASKITSGTLAAARIPIATASAVGGIKVGTTLAISDGVLNQKSGIATAGTYRSVTVDTYGRVTAGTNPTTLSGYGITNAYTKTEVDNALDGYLPLSGGTMTSAAIIRCHRVFTSISSGNAGMWAGSIYTGSLSESDIVITAATPSSDKIALMAGYVGIGTYKPAYKLDVDGDVRADNFRGSLIGNATTATKATQDGSGNTITSTYLPLSGGTMTGSIKMNAANKGYYLVDSAGVSYPALFDNGGYLCIGANATSGTHHTGSTYISAGSGEVYIIRLVNNSRTTYKNIDAGNTYVSSGKGYINGTEITTITGNAATATKATQDSDGQTITSTYLTSIGRSGDYITQTKGGTTSNVSNILERQETINFKPNAVGWYRVAQFISGAGRGNSVLLYLSRTYAYGNNESYIFAITTMYSGIVSISQLAGKYNSQILTKIRVDNPNSGLGYIDVYYNSDKENETHVTTIGSAHSLSSVAFNPTTVGTVTEYSISNGMGTSGNFIASGEVTAASDERLKTIVGDGNLDLRYIAKAPNILFKWNNGQDDKVHGGSLAQYFLTGAKHFVLGSDKDYYSLNYGALATSMAISIAKEVVKHDNEITRLKKEVVKLRERVAELEERRA